MSASATDYFMKTGKSTATTLSAPGYTVGNTSINVGTTAELPTDTGIFIMIDEVETVGGVEQRVAGTYNVFRGTVSSGTQISGLVYQGGDTNRNYSAGATTRVYMTISSYHTNRMIDALLVSHDQDGTLKAGAVDNAAVIADGIITPAKFTTALKGDWNAGLLPAVSSVTENGNRSADITFASTVASLLTPGMRIRTSRTVAAPTQSTSLNGTTQYYSKSSPNKLTFTDDFVVSAWVKLTSYTAGSVASRYNGTSGWQLLINGSGQVVLNGFNAGAANYSQVVSYQSLPLNRWVHIAAQLDMSSFTATTTTSYVMIDGTDLPCSVGRGGTNPTALVQAGDLQIGAANGSSFFPGAIAQVAIYNAKVTQANIRATKNQTLSGSETSIASAYSFNNVITDLNTTTPNDLTANGSAVATNAASPFCTDANGVAAGTYDWGIVTKVATTVATVQYPEGNAIPTSGGISAVDLSGVKAPFGMPIQKGRWIVEMVYIGVTGGATAATTSYNRGVQLTVPTGDTTLAYLGNLYGTDTAGTSGQVSTNLSLASASLTPVTGKLTSNAYSIATGASTTGFAQKVYAEDSVSMSTATIVYGNIYTENALDDARWMVPLGQVGGRGLTIYAITDHL